ncbi:MAG: 4a-hydroxytetrahydrobiopterin dehydratase, partial [Gammaproteobacteria bacterium]|nr:4a-hydroxytetrahydrobiopterin dehydratase [Gammaproteobacteria bacterium]
MTDLIPLAQARCVPRSGREHRLTDADVRELLPQVPGWELAEDGHALVRTFTFEDYYRTMAFVNALAFMAH